MLYYYPSYARLLYYVSYGTLVFFKNYIVILYLRYDGSNKYKVEKYVMQGHASILTRDILKSCLYFYKCPHFIICTEGFLKSD